MFSKKSEILQKPEGARCCSESGSRGRENHKIPRDRAQKEVCIGRKVGLKTYKGEA